jgi:hypothetical protein
MSVKKSSPYKVDPGFSGIVTDRFIGVACIGEEPMDHLEAGSLAQSADPELERVRRSLEAFVPDPQRKFLEGYQGTRGADSFVAGELIATGAINQLGPERIMAMIGLARKSKRTRAAAIGIIKEQFGLEKKVAKAPQQTVIVVQAAQSSQKGKSGAK